MINYWVSRIFNKPLSENINVPSTNTDFNLGVCISTINIYPYFTTTESSSFGKT